MPTKLTAKQEKYIELRLQGLNQSESYRGAYNAEKMAPETVAKRAIDLEKHGIIAGRIAARQSEVQQLVVDDVAATKSWAVGLLMSVALRCAQAAPVLDPFVGSGTTAIEAKRLGRRAIGIDLNAEYLDMAVRGLQLNRRPSASAAVADEQATMWGDVS